MKILRAFQIFLIPTAFALSACNYTLLTPSKPSDALPTGVLSQNTALEQSAIAVLSTNCASCHGSSAGVGGVANITSVDSLLSSGLIVPGNPGGSRLIQVVEQGKMPPTGPLSSADQATLSNWVAGGVIGGNNVGPTPTPILMPTPTPLPGGGSLADQAVAILQNNCIACHGVGGSGGVDQINNPAHLVSIGVIVPGSASTSKIYQAISSGVMPLSGPLAPADVATIANWINAGAANPGSPQPTPTPIPLLPTFASIDANILVPKCAACHAGNQARDGIRIDTYNSVLSYVTKGHAQGSKLYDITSSGEMPQGSGKLTAAELSVLSQWINAGAQNN